MVSRRRDPYNVDTDEITRPSEPTPVTIGGCEHKPRIRNMKEVSEVVVRVAGTVDPFPKLCDYRPE